jgi:formylglycine-generating enzyme required for sulfatase activity
MRRALATLGLLPLVGCTQILGVESIPGDSGVDAGHGMDATTADGHHESGREGGSSDAAAEIGAKRCAPTGVAVETFEADAGWEVEDGGQCSGVTPLCVDAGCVCIPGTGMCVDGGFAACEANDAAPKFVKPTPCAPTSVCSRAGCTAAPPSCALADAAAGENGITGCVPGTDNSKKESCCTSLEVPGGTFSLTTDEIPGGIYVDNSFPRTVSDFRLDRYEVTVGRFRPFAYALRVDRWVPEQGSGKHTHINGGYGLRNPADGGTVYETGWDSRWNAFLAPLASDAGVLQCHANPQATWTNTADSNDQSPIDCLTWFEAYAFCIWDGGFLPTEAEWNYAAAAGGDQRAYPWGNSLAADGGPCVFAQFVSGTPCNGNDEPIKVGSKVTYRGDSKFGQEDMAGNVVEWTLDLFDPTPSLLQTPQTDVAHTQPRDGGPDAPGILRVQRGGSFISDSDGIRTAFRGSSAEGDRSFVAGVRCARVP